MAVRKGDRRPETLKDALGFQLALCRKNAGYHTQDDFAQSIGKSSTPIAKVESGERLPSPDLFEAWVDACGVKGQLLLAIENMLHLARMRDDPQAYQAMTWEEVEEKARMLMYWELTAIPGITQTEDYARSLFMMWRNTPEKVEELTARRLRRRDILAKPDAPDVVIIIWERALYTPVGTPETMLAQIDLLLELSQMPNVYVQILAAGDRPGMGMAGPVSIAHTDTGEAVVMEAASESPVATEASQVRLAEAIFNDVRASAKNSADSLVIITEAKQTWMERAGASPASAVTPRATA